MWLCCAASNFDACQISVPAWWSRAMQKYHFRDQVNLMFTHWVEVGRVKLFFIFSVTVSLKTSHKCLITPILPIGVNTQCSINLTGCLKGIF